MNTRTMLFMSWGTFLLPNHIKTLLQIEIAWTKHVQNNLNLVYTYLYTSSTNTHFYVLKIWRHQILAVFYNFFPLKNARRNFLSDTCRMHNSACHVTRRTCSLSYSFCCSIYWYCWVVTCAIRTNASHFITKYINQKWVWRLPPSETCVLSKNVAFSTYSGGGGQILNFPSFYWHAV
jgi:hypothetical protein